MTTPGNARTRGAVLKQLREQHTDSVERTQALLKQQQTARRQICEVLRDSPQSVPAIAAATRLPADRVLWHITAMKKYGLVEESGMCGEYYLYQLPLEAK